jgi:hypothetical protein
LIAQDVDGLMMAGRCISGDFLAHSSYRVTGNAVAMGEASGITAALAAREQIAPHEVAWQRVHEAVARARAEPCTLPITSISNEADFIAASSHAIIEPRSQPEHNTDSCGGFPP